MQLGLVVGTATSTVKHATMRGQKLLVVQPLLADNRSSDGDPQIAVDAVGAGPGQRVMISSVIAGLPAYEGGLNANDELVAINGIRVDSNNTSERVNILNELPAGRRVTVTVFRREQLMTFELTAAVKPFDRYVITELKEAASSQIEFRQSWLSRDSANKEGK